MMNKKAIVALSVAVVISCVVLIGFFMLSKNNTVSIESVDTKAANNQQKLIITNRQQYQNTISNSYDADIKETLVTYLKLSLKTIPENISGIIRNDSYNVSQNSYGDVTEFIIDFPDLKISYKVMYSNDSSGYRAIYLKCLEKNERIYPEIKCMDNTNE